MKQKLNFVPSMIVAAVAVTSSINAAVVSYAGMDAAFDVSGGVAQSTGNIALDATYGTFNGAYDWNGGDPIITSRYYSGTIGITYDHGAWTTNNAVTVNFLLADGTTVGGRIGIPDGGWGNMRAEFPAISGGGGTLESVATSVSFDYQIKLTSAQYGVYQVAVFTGASATAETEGAATYSGSGNGPYVGSALSFVSFSTTGTAPGTATSSNFKSSDTWISAVPEPSSALLIGSGGFCLLLRRRNR